MPSGFLDIRAITGKPIAHAMGAALVLGTVCRAAVLSQGLRRMLEQEDLISVVGDAESGEEALERLQEDIADVVLLDARLGSMDGIETLRGLKSSSPDLKVIMLTSYGEEFVGATIEAGADGFFLKPGQPRRDREGNPRGCPGRQAIRLQSDSQPTQWAQ